MPAGLGDRGARTMATETRAATATATVGCSDDGDESSFSGGRRIGGDAERDPGTDGDAPSPAPIPVPPNADECPGVMVASPCVEGGTARGRGWMGVIPNAARTECARCAW